MKSPKEIVKSLKEGAQELVEKAAGNRTGISLHPANSATMAEAARTTAPTTAGDDTMIDALRMECIDQADPIGSVPPPPTPHGMLGAAGKAIQGEHLGVLIDALSARLTFERAGVRLYDALLAKVGAADGTAGVSRERLLAFRNDEVQHAAMVRDALEVLGADPTVLTPAADVNAVMSMGLPQAIQDPRTTLRQCLDAILVAELADNDGWAVLIELARGLGRHELATGFEGAYAQELVHLQQIREWVRRATLEAAGVADAAE